MQTLTWLLLDSAFGRLVGKVLAVIFAALALVWLGAKWSAGKAKARETKRQRDAYILRERIDNDVAQETDLVFRARRNGIVRPGD